MEKSSRFRRKNFLAAMGLVGVTQIGLRKFVSIPTLNNSDRIPPSNGRMAEWSNAPDSKSGIRLYRIEGSNPTPSAIFLLNAPLTHFLLSTQASVFQRKLIVSLVALFLFRNVL